MKTEDIGGKTIFHVNSSTGIVVAKEKGVYYVYSSDYPKEVLFPFADLPVTLQAKTALKVGQWIEFLAEQVEDEFHIQSLKKIVPLFDSLPADKDTVVVACNIHILTDSKKTIMTAITKDVYDVRKIVRNEHVGRTYFGSIAYYRKPSMKMWVVEHIEESLKCFP